MSSERLKTQVLFQDILGDNDYAVFEKKKKSEIQNFALSQNHVILFETTLREDALDFYYKGLVSLAEAIISVNNKGFSWATVKIYYSIYYYLRSSLCLSDVGFIRNGNEAYYFINNVGNNFISRKGTDHQATIDFFIEYCKTTDYLQSNNIDDKNPYNWVMAQRENVNYKHRTFFEPDVSDVWSTILSSIESNGLEYWIKTYLNDDIYSFLEDHAILAMPIKMSVITHNKFKENGINNPIRPEKTVRVKTLIGENGYLSFLEKYI